MSGDDGQKRHRRYAFIGMISVLMGAGIFIVGESFRDSSDSKPQVSLPVGEQDMNALRAELAVEAGPFQEMNQASRTSEPAKGFSGRLRHLNEFYGRRAYPGAPPVIPHKVQAEMEGEGQRSCLACHREGGFVSAFNAFAPVTPHPQYGNCRQCHLPQQQTALFKQADWRSVVPPRIGRAALPGGPPPIPHGLEMRSNCLSCHSGPGAVAEIRTPHPDRVNCRQCHVPLKESEVFERKVSSLQ